MADKPIDSYRTPEERVVVANQEWAVTVEPQHLYGLTTYFDAVIERLNYLENGDPSDFVLQAFNVQLAPCDLEAVWIPPRFRTTTDAVEEFTLDSVLADPLRSLIVLADPGCGKSTLARFLTCAYIREFCNKRRDHFAIYVPLNTLRVHGLSATQAVVESATRFVGLEKNSEVKSALIAHMSHCSVIFDGLDEVPLYPVIENPDDPPASRRDASQLIRTFLYGLNLQPGREAVGKTIVTSRTKDYFDVRECQIPNGSHYVMTRFTADQISTAVEKWHLAAKERLSLAAPRSGLEELIVERCAAIKGILRESQDLATVCQTPLLLSTLLVVYAEPSVLPTSVSQLCWKAIQWFLFTKHKTSSYRQLVLQHGEWILHALSDMGLKAHSNMVDGRSKVLSEELIRRIVAECPQAPKGTRRYEQRENEITRVAAFILSGLGILVPVSGTEYDFTHNVFREVLAGRSLGELDLVNRAKYAKEEGFHKPLSYWAGLKTMEKSGQYEVSVFISQLGESAKEGDIGSILIRGEILAEACATVPHRELTADLIRLLDESRKEILLMLKRADLRLSQRFRAGDILACIGDPRLETSPEARSIWIAPGPVVLGRPELHRTRIEKYQACPAAPVALGVLRPFRLGAYMVTNAEYRHFVNAGGYTTSRYWPGETSARWASHERQIIRELVERARTVAPVHLASELVGQRIAIDEIGDWCEQMIDRRLPLYWIDPLHNRPNQPVIGVNWWEAFAYCSWLTEQLRLGDRISAHEIVRLPTEAEWESTAKLCGGDKPYPWTAGEPSDNAHVKASYKEGDDPPHFRACAVGMYRSAPSNYEVFDLVGNAWEWTASRPGRHTSESFFQGVEGSEMNDRIARGSSWLSSEEESTQVTFRSFDPPYNAYEDLGFRIAIYNVNAEL